MADPGLCVDTGSSGGNGVVETIEADRASHSDQRDVTEWWFWWNVATESDRVREGTVSFGDDEVVGPR